MLATSVTQNSKKYHPELIARTEQVVNCKGPAKVLQSTPVMHQNIKSVMQKWKEQNGGKLITEQIIAS